MSQRCSSSEIKYCYSENYLNLDILYNTKGYVSVIDNYDKSCLAIFADLIDTQWDRTRHLVKELAKNNVPSIICGRNIVVWPTKEKINIYALNLDDILLRNKNIEDYMVECINPFLIPSRFETVLIISPSKNLIINPFGSENNKNLPANFIFEIIKSYKEVYHDSKIIIIAGFKNSYLHMLWCAYLKGKLIDNNLYEEIIFKNYGSFKEIKEEIDKYDVSLGLTSDTSIAHLFNVIGLKNVTFYNLARCDIESIQSLSSDSPLGFCRYGKIQFPCLIDKPSKKFISSVNSLLEQLNSNNLLVVDDEYISKFNELLTNPTIEKHNALIKEYNKSLQKNKIEWLNNIYNPEALTKYLDNKEKDLLIANWKICPLSKFGGLS